MGYKIFVNDKEVWESDGEAILVDRVSIRNHRGEVTTIGSPQLDEWMKIEVNSRNSPSDANTYLDIIEADKAQERREAIEGASADAVAEGRAAMEEEARQSEEEEEKEENPELGPPVPVPDMEF